MEPLAWEQLMAWPSGHMEGTESSFPDLAESKPLCQKLDVDRKLERSHKQMRERRISFPRG